MLLKRTKNVWCGKQKKAENVNSTFVMIVPEQFSHGARYKEDKQRATEICEKFTNDVVWDTLLHRETILFFESKKDLMMFALRYTKVDQ